MTERELDALRGQLEEAEWENDKLRAQVLAARADLKRVRASLRNANVRLELWRMRHKAWVQERRELNAR